MIIEKLSENFAMVIKTIVPNHPSSLAVIRHGTAIFINTISIVIFTMLISLFTGKLIDTIIIMAAFAFLRMFSGGLHLKTGASCVALTTSLFTGISLISVPESVQIYLIAISAILTFVYAPAKVKKTRIPESFFPHLKVISVFIVLLSFWILSSALTLSFFVQTLLLIHRKEVKEMKKRANNTAVNPVIYALAFMAASLMGFVAKSSVNPASAWFIYEGDVPEELL